MYVRCQLRRKHLARQGRVLPEVSLQPDVLLALQPPHSQRRRRIGGPRPTRAAARRRASRLRFPTCFGAVLVQRSSGLQTVSLWPPNLELTGTNANLLRQPPGVLNLLLILLLHMKPTTAHQQGRRCFLINNALTHTLSSILPSQSLRDSATGNK